MQQYLDEKIQKVSKSNLIEFTEAQSKELSCARSNTKIIDRNVHLRHDKVDNFDGPLLKSVYPVLDRIPSLKHEFESDIECTGEKLVSDRLTIRYYKNESHVSDALDERVSNLESILLKDKREDSSGKTGTRRVD